MGEKLQHTSNIVRIPLYIPPFMIANKITHNWKTVLQELCFGHPKSIAWFAQYQEFWKFGVCISYWNDYALSRRGHILPCCYFMHCWLERPVILDNTSLEGYPQKGNEHFLPLWLSNTSGEGFYFVTQGSDPVPVDAHQMAYPFARYIVKEFYHKCFFWQEMTEIFQITVENIEIDPWKPTVLFKQSSTPWTTKTGLWAN